MKRIGFVCGLWIFLLFFCIAAQAAEYPQDAQRLLDDAPISAQEFQDKSFGSLVKDFFGQIAEQAAAPARLGGETAVLFVLAVLCLSVLEEKSSREPAGFIVLLSCILLLWPPVNRLLADLSGQASVWNEYLAAFIPVYAGVMAAGGQTSGAAVYSGMLLTVSSLLSQMVCTLLLPTLQIYLCILAGALLWGNSGLADAAKAFLKLIKAALKGLSILFSVVLGFQSLLAAETDNLALKTGKFILNGVVPVVGASASSALSCMAAGMKLLKGLLSFAALAAMGGSFLPLAVLTAEYWAVFALLCVAAKCVGLNRCATLAEGLSNSLQVLLAFLSFYFSLVMVATLVMTLGGG